MSSKETYPSSPEALIKNNFMVVISGPTASGKDSIINFFCQQYPQVHKIVSYTTRHQRPNEVEGVNYHFITKTQYMLRRKDLVFETERMIDGEIYYYGMDKNELTPGTCGGATICSIDLPNLVNLPQILSTVFSDTPIQNLSGYVVPIYLGANRLTTLKDRYFQRHRVDDERPVFLSRLRKEWKEWQQFKDVIPHTIINDQPLIVAANSIARLVNELA